MAGISVEPVGKTAEQGVYAHGIEVEIQLAQDELVAEVYIGAEARLQEGCRCAEIVEADARRLCGIPPYAAVESKRQFP